MEEVKDVLALFDTVDKWRSYIELANMKTDLLNELKNRLITELKKIAEMHLDSAWTLYCDYNSICIKPSVTPLIEIIIQWHWWNTPWCRRGVCLWVDAKNTDSMSVFSRIREKKSLLPLQEYVENIQNHSWFPFVKKIPSKVFDVRDEIVSIDECLFKAKDKAEQLAYDLWHEVFEPFSSKEIAHIFEEIIK
ncbi:MAG: hypothetical protein IKU03_06670 [Bacteroidales bacterium]|nr:hypothetical protein [Bacteroidales bacterium]